MPLRLACFVGLDGTGKTPLIEMLSNSLQNDGHQVEVLQVLKDPRGKTHEQIMCTAEDAVSTFTAFQLPEFREGPVKYIILDRFPFPDQFVYNPKDFTAEEFFAWDKIIRELGVKYVMIRPRSVADYLRTVEEHAKSADEYQPVTDIEWVEGIYRRYETFARRTTVSTLTIEQQWFGPSTVAYLRKVLYGHDVAPTEVRTDSPDQYAPAAGRNGSPGGLQSGAGARGPQEA